MIFRDECGFIAEVELVEEKRSDKGVSTTFRVLRTLATPDGIPAEELPKPGETFTAWKSHNIIRHGWRLTDFY